MGLLLRVERHNWGFSTMHGWKQDIFELSDDGENLIT